MQGCTKDFTSVTDRKKHLSDSHAYSTQHNFDKLHLGKRQAQQRPAAGYQKAVGGQAAAHKTAGPKVGSAAGFARSKVSTTTL